MVGRDVGLGCLWRVLVGYDQYEPEVSVAEQNLSICRIWHIDFEFCEVMVDRQQLSVWAGCF